MVRGAKPDAVTNTGGSVSKVSRQAKEVTWTSIQIDRFENGRIAESWVDWDKYRLFAQLGLVK